jgi:hypothetical protein
VSRGRNVRAHRGAARSIIRFSMRERMEFRFLGGNLGAIRMEADEQGMSRVRAPSGDRSG